MPRIEVTESSITNCGVRNCQCNENLNGGSAPIAERGKISKCNSCVLHIPTYTQSILAIHLHTLSPSSLPFTLLAASHPQTGCKATKKPPYTDLALYLDHLTPVFFTSSTRRPGKTESQAMTYSIWMCGGVAHSQKTASECANDHKHGQQND